MVNVHISITFQAEDMDAATAALAELSGLPEGAQVSSNVIAQVVSGTVEAGELVATEPT